MKHKYSDKDAAKVLAVHAAIIVGGYIVGTALAFCAALILAAL